MTDIIKTVGGRVRLYRQKAGLSQQALGDIAGLHNTYIGQVERGEKSVSIESIDKIIKALGLSYETFYAKLGKSDDSADGTASKCYELILNMDEKNQQYIYEIIRSIEKMIKK